MDAKISGENQSTNCKNEKYHPLISRNIIYNQLTNAIGKIDSKKKGEVVDVLNGSFENILSCFKCKNLLKEKSSVFLCGHKYCAVCSTNLKNCINCKKENNRSEIKDFSKVIDIMNEIKSNFNSDKIIYELIKYALLLNNNAEQDDRINEDAIKFNTPKKIPASNDASLKKSKKLVTKSKVITTPANKNEKTTKKLLFSKENSIDRSMNIIENDSENLFMETVKNKVNGRKVQSYLEQQPSLSEINFSSTSGGKIKRKRISDITSDDFSKEKTSKRVKKDREFDISKIVKSESNSPDLQNQGTFFGFSDVEIKKSENKFKSMSRIVRERQKCEGLQSINDILSATGESKIENVQDTAADPLEAVKSLVELETKLENTLISVRKTGTEELDLDIWKRKDKYERRKSLFKSVKERNKKDVIKNTFNLLNRKDSETENMSVHEKEKSNEKDSTSIIKSDVSESNVTKNLPSPINDKENKPLYSKNYESSSLFLENVCSSTPYEVKKCDRTYSKVKNKLFHTPTVNVSPITECDNEMSALKDETELQVSKASSKSEIVVCAEVHHEATDSQSFKTSRALRSYRKVSATESPISKNSIKTSNGSEFENRNENKNNELVPMEVDEESNQSSKQKSVINELSLTSESSQEKRIADEHMKRKNKVKRLQNSINNKNEKTLADLKKNFQVNSPKQLSVEKVKNPNILETSKKVESNNLDDIQEIKQTDLEGDEYQKKDSVEKIETIQTEDLTVKKIYTPEVYESIETTDTKTKTVGQNEAKENCLDIVDSKKCDTPKSFEIKKPKTVQQHQKINPSPEKCQKTDISETSCYGEDLSTQKRSPIQKSVGSQTTSDLHIALLKLEFPHLFEKFVSLSVYNTPIECLTETKTPENGVLKANSKYTAVSSITSSEMKYVDEKDFTNQSVLGESMFSVTSANKTAISGYAPLSPEQESPRNERTVICRLNFEESVFDDTLQPKKNKSEEIEVAEIRKDEDSCLSVSILDNNIVSEIGMTNDLAKSTYDFETVGKALDTDCTVCDGGYVVEAQKDTDDEDDDVDYVVGTPTSAPRRSINSSIEKMKTPLEMNNHIEISLNSLITPKNVTPLINPYLPKDISQMSGIKKQSGCTNEFTPEVESQNKNPPKASLELFNSMLVESPVNTAIYITTTGLKDVDMKLVKRFCDKFGATLLDKLSEKSSHLIVKTEDDNTTNRTFKYLQAIVNGLIIVSLKWILECINENKIINEEKFIPLDSSKECGPLRAYNFMKGLTPSPLSWLKDYCIYFTEPVPQGCTLLQLQGIMKQTGSTVIDDVKEFKKYLNFHHIIIFSDDDENDDVSHDEIAEWLQTYQAVSIEFNWILEVIGRNRMIPFAKYEVLEIPIEYLKQLHFPSEMLEFEDDEESD